jgi:hypothetical protein
MWRCDMHLHLRIIRVAANLTAARLARSTLIHNDVVDDVEIVIYEPTTAMKSTTSWRPEDLRSPSYLLVSVVMHGMICCTGTTISTKYRRYLLIW